MSGVERIADERERQKAQWSAENDDTHTPRDGMARTAVSLINDWSTEETPAWGIHLTTKTRGDRVRQLTIAGALVAAEIDRLERLAARGEPQPCDAPSDDELQAQGSRENEALFRGWLKRVAELEHMETDEGGPRFKIIEEIHANVAERYPLGIAVQLNEVIGCLSCCGSHEDLEAADLLEDLADAEKRSREINGWGP